MTQEELNSPTSITILNILSVPPDQLSIWVSKHLLSVRLPENITNSTFDVRAEIVPLLPLLANRISFATELYNIVVGNKPGWAKSKRDKTDTRADDVVAILTANIDILYRTIQTVYAQYEMASRLMTGLSNFERISQR